MEIQQKDRSLGVDGQEHRSLDRLLRMFGRFVGTGYLIYLGLLFTEITRSSYLTSSWWTPTATVAVFGTGAALGAATFLPSIRWTRIAAGVAALTYLVGVGTWWLAWDGTTYDESGLYLSTFAGLASLAAALAWRAVPTAAYLVVAVVSTQVSNFAVRRPFVEPTLPADIAFGLMFCTIFVAAMLGALRTARILDATIATTHADAASAAAADARAVERERFDALIHDGVMSSLLSVARQGRTESVARQTRATLDQLDALRDYTSHGQFGREDAVSHLRAAATDVDEAVTVEILGSADGASTFPADVVRAIGAALAEAVRNSVRHAGRGSSRIVRMRFDDSRLAISVFDNGVGFDPSSVPPHRLGLAVSIKGRMQQLDGGAATIESSHGRGTIVRLVWLEPR